MTKLTAKEVYEKLLREDGILALKGQIKFFLGDVSIIVRQRDVVGNIMQEWLEGWFKLHNIEYIPNPNSQMPPDFFLDVKDRTKGQLEVKAFNIRATPGFDIADFNAYSEEIIEKPYSLDTDYLIFGYDMSEDGIVTIEKMWLKKVWQITRRMESWSINLQIKDGVVHKIRPGKWDAEEDGRADYKMFESLEDFISAMDEAVYKNPKTHDKAGMWLTRFLRSYKEYYGIDLSIPRWIEIKDKYDLKAVRTREKAQANYEKAKEQLVKAKSALDDAQQSYELALENGVEAEIERAATQVEKRMLAYSKKAEKAKDTQDRLNKLL